MKLEHTLQCDTFLVLMLRTVLTYSVQACNLNSLNKFAQIEFSSINNLTLIVTSTFSSVYNDTYCCPALPALTAITMEDLTCCTSIGSQYSHMVHIHYNHATTKCFSMSTQYALWLHAHCFHSHTEKVLSKPRSLASLLKSKRDSVSLWWNRV